MLDRRLQSSPRVVDFLTKACGYMTIRSNFHGDFIANSASAAGPGRFGTPRLSGVSDFATRVNDMPQGRMNLRKLTLTAALVACASPAFAESSVFTSNCKHSRYYGYSNCRETS